MSDKHEHWQKVFEQLYLRLMTELQRGEALVTADLGYSGDGKKIVIADAVYNELVKYLRQSLNERFAPSSFYQETEEWRIEWRITDKSRLQGTRLSCSMQMAMAGRERYNTRLHLITNNLANLYNLRPSTKPFIFRGEGNLLIGQKSQPFTIYFNEINKRKDE